MVKAFISYSHFDRSFVDRFVKDLRAQNISFWRDWEEIPPWDAWDDDVQYVLSNGTVSHCIYVHSESAANSVNVKNELRLVANKKIKTIVLGLDDTPVPLSVMAFTPYKIYKDYSGCFENLIYWLNKESPTVPVRPPKITPRELRQSRPTKDQIIAAHDSENKRIRVIAGPGTGKSFVIEERVKSRQSHIRCLLSVYTMPH